MTITNEQKEIMQEIAEATAKEVVKEAVPEAVKQTLENLGVDTTSVNEVQKDFIWLRRVRTLADSVWTKAVIAVAVAITMYALGKSTGITG